MGALAKRAYRDTAVSFFSSSFEPAPLRQRLSVKALTMTASEATLLPTQGSTQVYSPFGSYVVEQHGDDAGCRHAEPEADRPTRADPVAAIRRRLGEAAHRLRVKQSPDYQGGT